MSPLYAFVFGTQEMIIILIIGVLLFGRKLPEVGRYLRKGIVEFKTGIRGLEDQINVRSSPAPPAPPQQLEQPRPPQRMVTTAPKFEDGPANITNSPKG